MNKSEILDLLDAQVKAKVADLNEWRSVRWEGGRLYYETTKIINEIQNYPIEYKIIYLEKLLNSEFTVQDNLPDEAPDITLNLKNWLVKKVSQLKINSLRNSKEIENENPVPIELVGLNFDNIILNTLQSRIGEIIKGIKAKAPLSVIFLTGSTLEGILLGMAKKYPKTFNETKCSPKQEGGKVKILSQWTLNDFINSAYEIGLINEDLKKFSHVMRDFRNYIHPFEQINSGFNPTMDTAKVCWQVLQMAVVQIIENQNLLEEKASA